MSFIWSVRRPLWILCVSFPRLRFTLKCALFCEVRLSRYFEALRETSYKGLQMCRDMFLERRKSVTKLCMCYKLQRNRAAFPLKPSVYFFLTLLQVLLLSKSSKTGIFHLRRTGWKHQHRFFPRCHPRSSWSNLQRTTVVAPGQHSH